MRKCLFSFTLLLAKKLHVVTDNDYMTHLHNLHDRAEYKQYLYSVIQDIHEEAALADYVNLLPIWLGPRPVIPQELRLDRRSDTYRDYKADHRGPTRHAGQTPHRQRPH
ncbi:hypothetical protein ACEQ8H_000251 [Pleosporales sp. CAS-2024a]